MGIALRSTGSIDFYYDFKLVESWEAESNKRCICIDSDFTDLHFKCYEKSEDPENPYERVDSASVMKYLIDSYLKKAY